MEILSLPNMIYFELSPFIYVNLFILITSLTNRDLNNPQFIVVIMPVVTANNQTTILSAQGDTRRV